MPEPGETPASVFRYDGRFDLEYLRPDERVRSGGPSGECEVVRDGNAVPPLTLEIGDWFARHDDELGTPFVVPADVAYAIVEQEAEGRKAVAPDAR